MLTGKQRSYLKGLANAVPAIMQVGKAGITDSLITQVDEYLEQHELVKGSVLKNALFTAREVCEELAEELSAEYVQVIGNKFVIYRESKENKQILLPK